MPPSPFRSGLKASGSPLQRRARLGFSPNSLLSLLKAPETLSISFLYSTTIKKVKSIIKRTTNHQEPPKKLFLYELILKKETQRICGRALKWEHDDELSIAIIAFNEAIDAYEEEKNKSFIAFARLVIKRRLVDYFRKNASPYSLPGEEVIDYQTKVYEDWERSEREEEITNYHHLLQQFNINFKKVAKAQPKHRKVKDKLLRVAKIMSEEKELMEHLYYTGKLPKQELCKMAGVTYRMLDRSRVYVIALALLLYHDDFPFLRDYVGELIKGEGTYEEKSKRDSIGKK